MFSLWCGPHYAHNEPSRLRIGTPEAGSSHFYSTAADAHARILPYQSAAAAAASGTPTTNFFVGAAGDDRFTPPPARPPALVLMMPRRPSVVRPSAAAHTGRTARFVRRSAALCTVEASQ